MVSSRTVFWLLLASLLVLQVLAEVGSPAGHDEHALDRLKRSPVPSSSHGNSHGKKLAKKSSTKSHEKRKLKPMFNTKRSSADRNRRNKKEQSKKSTRRPKPH